MPVARVVGPIVVAVVAGFFVRRRKVLSRRHEDQIAAPAVQVVARVIAMIGGNARTAAQRTGVLVRLGHMLLLTHYSAGEKNREPAPRETSRFGELFTWAQVAWRMPTVGTKADIGPTASNVRSGSGTDSDGCRQLRPLLGVKQT